MDPGAQLLSPFYSAQDPNLQKGATNTQGESFLLYGATQKFPCRCVHRFIIQVILDSIKLTIINHCHRAISEQVVILISGSTGCRVKGAWSCNGLAGSHTCGKQPDSAVLLAQPWVPAPYKMGLEVHACDDTTCSAVCYCLFFKTRFLYVALAILELTLQTRLASKSEIQLTLPPECWD